MCKWTTAEIQGPYQQAAIIRHHPPSAIGRDESGSEADDKI